MRDEQEMTGLDVGTDPDADQIRADRACIGCGFNLYGQTVTKEPHYGLAIARCPECGVVASLQQYPVMTHWGNRFRAMIAGLYLVLLLGLFALSTLTISAFATNAADLASNNFAHHLGRSWTVWTQAKDAAAQPGAKIDIATGNAATTTSSVTVNGVTTNLNTGTVVNMNGSFEWVTLTPDWMDTQYQAARESFGGLWKNKDNEMYVFLLPAALIATIFGIFWSVALLGGSRRRVLLAPTAMVLISLVFLIGLNTNANSYPWASRVAERAYTPMIVPLVLCVQLLFMVIGVWLGRSIARGVVRLALPPRARLPLSILWTRDGLEPPRPTTW